MTSTFHKFSVNDLKNIIRKYNLITHIKGYSKMKKDNLVTEISKHLELNDNNEIKIKMKNSTITITSNETPKPKPKPKPKSKPVKDDHDDKDDKDNKIDAETLFMAAFAPHLMTEKQRSIIDIMKLNKPGETPVETPVVENPDDYKVGDYIADKRNKIPGTGFNEGQIIKIFENYYLVNKIWYKDINADEAYKLNSLHFPNQFFIKKTNAVKHYVSDSQYLRSANTKRKNVDYGYFVGLFKNDSFRKAELDKVIDLNYAPKNQKDII
jgi:hypothetical protein